MNKYCKQSFDKIKGAAAGYRRRVADVLSKYRATMDTAKEQAKMFKDENAHVAGARAGAITTARNAIKIAQNDFSAVVGAEISVLRDELSRHIAAVPSDNYINLLRVYSDFGIIPSRMEIDSLLTQAGNSTLSLRVLNRTLEKVGSEYRIEYQDTGELEADIAALDKLATEPIMYSPDGLHPAAVDVFGGTRRPVRLVAGGPLTDQAGFVWDNTSIITASLAFEAAVAGLDAMSERWNASIPPKIYDAKIYADHRDEQTGADISGAEEFVRDNTAPTGRVTEDRDTRARYAVEMSKQRAAEDAKARETLEKYM